MEFGIFNLMGAREADKPTAQVFGEAAEQIKLADELGYTIVWFAEHHFSNYCLCASPLMMVAHCLDHQDDPAGHRGGGAAALQSGPTRRRDRHRRRAVERPADARIGAGYQPYEFERFGADITENLEMTEEFCQILDLAFSRDFFSYQGKHYRRTPAARTPTVAVARA